MVLDSVGVATEAEVVIAGEAVVDDVELDEVRTRTKRRNGSQ